MPELVEVTAEQATETQPSESERDSARVRDFLAEAHRRFQSCVDAPVDARWRLKARAEFNFLAGEHWPEALIAERGKDRPTLTFDRISAACKRVINGARQNPPSPKVNAVGQGATKEEAEIIQGLIRNIEVDSRSEIAEETAYDHAVKVGKGFFRINVDYEDENSFEQKIVIERIPSPFIVYMDPSSVEFGAEDAMFCFITERMTHEEFKVRYPNAELASLSSFQGIGDDVQDYWCPNGEIVVAQYYHVVEAPKTIYQFADGSVSDTPPQDDTNLVSSRRTVERKVKWAKINAVEILEETDWLGKWIPIVPVYGEEILIDGQLQRRGMVGPAMDANLMFDYMVTKHVEQIGLTPISPLVAAMGQIEGLEDLWNSSNRVPRAVLPYKPVSNAGVPEPPPQRQPASPDVAAVAQAIQIADTTLKATLDTYDPSLGVRQAQQSGKAIQSLQAAGDAGHFDFADNFARAQNRKGQIILDLIPKVYKEAERILHIISPDGTSSIVTANPAEFQQGLKNIFRTNVGRYDIVMDTGPSFPTRKKEGFAELTQLAANFPQLANALDLIIKISDIPYADQIADRVRPPGVQAEQEGQAPIPPQAQQQIAQMEQMIKQLSGMVQSMSEEIKQKRLELGSDERQTLIGALKDILIAEIKTGSAQTTEMLKQEVAAITARFAQLAGAQDTANPATQPQQSQQAEPVA